MSIKDKVGGHYNEFVIELEDYQLLPMTCRQTIAKYKDEYDYFIFTENDHLWLEHHVDRFIEYNSIIPEVDNIKSDPIIDDNDIPAFLRKRD